MSTQMREIVFDFLPNVEFTRIAVWDDFASMPSEHLDVKTELLWLPGY